MNEVSSSQPQHFIPYSPYIPYPLSPTFQIALQLFDARADLHKATCNYTLDLNYMHAKKTPDFLNQLVSKWPAAASCFL